MTPAGSNLFPRESCLPCVCVYPHRCGFWKPRLSSWLLVPAVVSQARHHSLSSPPQGAAFLGGRVAEQQPRPSQVPLWPCQGGMCCASLAVAIMAITPISSLLLPVSMWGKTSVCKKKDRLGDQTKRSVRIAQFNSRPWHFSADSQRQSAACTARDGWQGTRLPRVCGQSTTCCCRNMLQERAAGTAAAVPGKHLCSRSTSTAWVSCCPTCCASLSPFTQRQC